MRATADVTALSPRKAVGGRSVRRRRRGPAGASVGREPDRACPPGVNEAAPGPSTVRHGTGRPPVRRSPSGELPTITCRPASIKVGQAALTESAHGSPLARWPHDPRHACPSSWLNGGVYPGQVAESAGHGIDVPVRIYATCVVGQDELARRRISEALRQADLGAYWARRPAPGHLRRAWPRMAAP
jgi:hypothetical protein